MKAKINIISIFILALMLGSCSEDKVLQTENEKSDQAKIEQEKLETTPDFRAFFFGDRESFQKMYFGFFIETESDLIRADAGCYTVNVRVYMTSTVNGSRFLVASDNAVICEESAKSNINSNSKSSNKCNGKLKNGDYIVENMTTEHICLFELLSKNKEVYYQYKESVNRLLSNF